MLQKPVWTKLKEPEDVEGGNDSLHRGDPNILSGLISGELMVRHGVGLPGNDRQIVSVDIGESS